MKDCSKHGKMENYVVFAMDAFGNPICFDKTNNKIVFIDHETHSAEEAANSFTKFIKNLKKIYFKAAKILTRLRDDILKVGGKITPFVLCVICGMSNAAYKRPDGVFVVLITTLKNW